MVEAPETSPDRPGRDTWQLLEQFALPAGPVPAEVLLDWLANVLAPLDLYPDLLEKINASIQAAAATDPVLSPHNSHRVILSLYAPRDGTGSRPACRNWGFYRVGKARVSNESGHPIVGHSIDIYLYPEG